MKYKYQENQRVKVIFPPVHPYYDKIGTIVKINKKHIMMFYYVEFEDEKKHYFQEKELEVVENKDL